jgi:hypothetical protein
VEVIATEETIEAVETEDPTLEAVNLVEEGTAVNLVEEGTEVDRDRTLAPITNNVETGDPTTQVKMTGHRDTMIKHTMLINPTTLTEMHSLHICNNTDREETLNAVTINHRIVPPAMLTRKAVIIAPTESQKKTVATLMID